MLEQHAGDGRRQNLPAPSIQFVAPEGMPYMRHMHTDLMSAARENPYLKQAVALPLVQHAPLAAGFLAVFRHRNLDLHRGMPAERRIHRARRRGDPLHQRKVFLPYFPCRERLGKPHPRLFRERHADKPGGVFVQTVHDAGPEAFLRRKDGKRATSRWTSVPSGQLGAGCTVMPAGLLSTASHAS